jgi:adenosylhomocysteine nucleosidase
MLLVLTPLKKELDLLSQSLGSHGWNGQIEKKGHLTGIVYKEPAVALFVGGHGKSQFAIQTQYLLHHFENVNSVLCIGAAGSLTESVKPGDLVIAAKTVEHDFHLKFIQRPLPAFAADAALLSRAARVRAEGLVCHTGAVASGDEDIIDGLRAAEIFQKTDALAVAWEGAGGARACQFNRVPYLEVRAVTDFADKAAVADFARNLERGMAAAALFLKQFAVLPST